MKNMSLHGLFFLGLVTERQFGRNAIISIIETIGYHFELDFGRLPLNLMNGKVEAKHQRVDQRMAENHRTKRLNI